MFINIKNKKRRGFTLIELTVSIFIITIITGIFLTNYHSTNKRQELIMAAQKMASNIRLAQSYALGAKEFNGSAPAGGWGARFVLASSNYTIFADADGDFSYGTGEEYNTINLPNGITIGNINGVISPLDLVFYPPDPIVYFKGAPAVDSVQIQLTDGDTVKTVEVNFLGLVDVVD